MVAVQLLNLTAWHNALQLPSEKDAVEPIYRSS